MRGAAGGYQIQRLGGVHVTSLVGSYTGVVGLPLVRDFGDAPGSGLSNVMSERRAYLDIGFGETRGVVTLDGRPERLFDRS